GTQLPFVQTSFSVQLSPSLHGLALFTNWQSPDGETHVSFVHGFWSLHVFGAPGVHWPPLQASPSVQPSSSSHGAVLLVAKQPGLESQRSSVQGLRSLHTTGVPAAQWPPLQTSPLVQALPSSHGTLLLGFSHPLLGLQLSSVHGLLSTQSGGGPPWQEPPEQVSPVVQAVLLLHGSVLFANTHPGPGMQLSSVQGVVAWH